MLNADTAPASTYMPSVVTAARQPQLMPSAYVPSVWTAAHSLKVVPGIVPVHSDVEIETAIIALGREPGGGLVVMPDNFAQVHRAPIISTAARNNVPADEVIE